jgi:hypothetical protein
MNRALILAMLLAGTALPATSLAAAAPSAPAHADAVDPAAKALAATYFAWRGGAAFEAMTSVHEKGQLETAGLKGVAESWMARDGRSHDTFDLGGAFTGGSATGSADAWSMDQGLVEDMPAATQSDNRRDIAMEFGDAFHGRGGASVSPIRLAMAGRGRCCGSASATPTPMTP